MDKKFMRMYFDLAGEQIASDIWRKKGYRKLEKIADKRLEKVREELADSKPGTVKLFEKWLDMRMRYESILMEEYYLLGAKEVE